MSDVRFIKVEDEADMRVRFKNIVRMHGRVGLLQAIGKMTECTNIALEVLREEVDAS